MTEQGASSVAAFSGAETLGSRSRLRRRPLLLVAGILAAILLTAASASGQSVGGVRIGAIAYPDTTSLYLLLEYRGDVELGMERSVPLILSGKTIVHLSAAAVAPVRTSCEAGKCVYYERALFRTTRAELVSLADSPSAVIVLVTPRRTILGRLEFASLATIRRFVRSLSHRSAT